MSSTVPPAPFGMEVEEAVLLLTTAGLREEVSSLATPCVPPLELTFGPPGGATKVSFWETRVFFTMELGDERLGACPGDGRVVPSSKLLEEEEQLWLTDTFEPELLEEATCRERATKGDLNDCPDELELPTCFPV